MKKILSVLLCLTILAVCAGCAGTSPAAQSTADVDLAAAMQTIRAQVELPEMMDLTNENLLDYFGIEESLFSQAAACVNANGYEKEEILLLQAVDSSAVSQLTTQLEQSLQNAAEEMQNYLPEQYAMIRDSRVETSGLYVWLFVSNSNEQIREIWNDCLNA